MLTMESSSSMDWVAAPIVEQYDDRPAPFTITSFVNDGTVKSIANRTHIFMEGDEKSCVYVVESGALSIYKLLSDGRRQVIDFALPGDIVGLGTGRHYNASAQTTMVTVVRCVPYAALHRAARFNPELGMKLYEIMSEEVVAARDLLLTVGQRSAIQRVAAFLLALSARNRRNGGDEAVVRLPMTRTDIGDFLGLTIETVSRTITKLKSNGTIRLGQRGVVYLTKLDELEDLCVDP